MTKKICIVDDHLSMRQMLRFALTAYDLEVFEASSGVDALAVLSAHHVDMLIVDWQIPQMNGSDLIRRLRKNEHYANLPIAVFSGMDDLDARKEARALGVMTWLKKPFRIADVQRVVELGLDLKSRKPSLLSA